MLPEKLVREVGQAESGLGIRKSESLLQLPLRHTEPGMPAASSSWESHDPPCVFKSTDSRDGWEQRPREGTKQSRFCQRSCSHHSQEPVEDYKKSSQKQLLFQFPQADLPSSWSLTCHSHQGSGQALFTNPKETGCFFFFWGGVASSLTVTLPPTPLTVMS